MAKNFGRGQITIVDYNDAVSLTSYLSANQPLVQIFTTDNNTYTPNYASTALTITPMLYISSTTEEIVGNANNTISGRINYVKYYINDEASPSLYYTKGANPLTIDNNADFTISSSKPYAITSNKNLFDKNFYKIVCEIGYQDPVTNAILIAKSSITIAKTINAGSSLVGICGTPNGNIFKNNNISSLIATFDLWKGSTVVNSGIVYGWYKRNYGDLSSYKVISINTNTITLDDPPDSFFDAIYAGCEMQVGSTTGLIISSIDKAVNSITFTSSFSVSVNDTVSLTWFKIIDGHTFGTTNYTTKTITIPNTAVLNFETFKCIATYDSQKVADFVSFTDLSDPISIDFYMPQGNFLRNGEGSLSAKAMVYRGGSLVDPDGTMYGYFWQSFNKYGTENSAYIPTCGIVPNGKDYKFQITTVTSSINAESAIVADASFLKDGMTVQIGNSESNVKAITLSGNSIQWSGNITTSAGTPIYMKNYKNIEITSANVDGNTTFVCNLIAP